MKKGIIVLTVILMMMLFSCGKDKHGNYSDIYESFGNIENYCANITVKTKGEDGSSYTARQYYLAPDLYRLDFTSEGMENTSCILKGDKLYFIGPDGVVTEIDKYVPEEKYYVFVTDFMERYIKSETAKSVGEGNKTILELEEGDGEMERALVRLHINNKNNTPEKMETFNHNGEKVIEVRFSGFKMNTKIDKKIFNI